MEAMKGVFNRNKKLFLHADGKKEIIAGFDRLSRSGISDVVLVGATDAYYIIDFLKENNIPVLLNEIHRLPGLYFEDIDMPFKLPYLLHSNGLMVGLTYRDELQSSRNLPFFCRHGCHIWIKQGRGTPNDHL
jgi:hypothetical protein